MGTTSKGIWYPDSTDQVTPLNTTLATMQTSTDTALNGKRWDTPAGVHVVANAAGLTALIADLTALGYTVGTNNPIYAERSDTGLLYRNAGSGWVAVVPDPASFPNVRYDASQSLTLGQKTQARSNIDAAAAADVTALENFQSTEFGGMAWANYTPIWNGMTALGNGASSGSYCRVGDVIFVSIIFQAGSTTTWTATSGIMIFPSLPVAGSGPGNYPLAGWLFDASGAEASRWMNVSFVPNSYMIVGGTRLQTPSGPIALANGDIIRLSGFYQA